jgi:hypothetical protein
MTMTTTTTTTATQEAAYEAALDAAIAAHRAYHGALTAAIDACAPWKGAPGEVYATALAAACRATGTVAAYGVTVAADAALGAARLAFLGA